MNKKISKEIYINSNICCDRVAILEDKSLVELYVDFPDQEKLVGNIYKGIVQNVIPGMQAAFIDINYDTNAFLPFSEIGNNENLANLSFSDSKNKNPKSSKNKFLRFNPDKDLNIGDEIIVQVIKEPFGGKGARVTTDISFPGTMMVLVPKVNFIGISRKIRDKYEKRRLRKIIENFKPKDCGVIVRTIAEGKNEEILFNDFDRLNKQWKICDKKNSQKTVPNLLYNDLSVSDQVIRDLFNKDITNIHVDSKQTYKRIQNYIKQVNPQQLSKINYYNKKEPIFYHHNIEEQISKSLNRKVWLKSGGHLVIDHTEAMIVIDVNSGRFIGKKNHEENSLKINIEAAKECAKQLRLRDIGGLIVIDFIDLEKAANKYKVFEIFKKELRRDAAKVAISEFSNFGLLEMTRQRVKLNLLDSMSNSCEPCDGKGFNFREEIILTNIENAIKNHKLKTKEKKFDVYLHPSLIAFINKHIHNLKRSFLWKNYILLNIVEDKTVDRHRYKIYSSKSKKFI